MDNIGEELNCLKCAKGVAVAKLVINAVVFIVWCIGYAVSSRNTLLYIVLIGLVATLNAAKIVFGCVKIKRTCRLCALVLYFLADIIITSVLITLLFACVGLSERDIASWLWLMCAIFLTAGEVGLLINYLREKL